MTGPGPNGGNSITGVGLAPVGWNGRGSMAPVGRGSTAPVGRGSTAPVGRGPNGGNSTTGVGLLRNPVERTPPCGILVAA
jgi:hypothetical protein